MQLTYRCLEVQTMVLRLLLLQGLFFSFVWGLKHHHVFKVEQTSYTRLCSTKKILTVNGLFPGPTLYAHKGDTLVVDVINNANENITLHWHGVKQPRNPWSDGPEYITQCAIQPGASFRYTIVTSTEEGTVWWHAHSAWTIATVHGAIVIFPVRNSTYPFPKPHQDFVLIIGEWWKRDVRAVHITALQTDGEPEASDAYTINGQPGDLYACSKNDTFKVQVQHGKRYLFRVVGAALSNPHFFSIAGHQMTLVGSDGSYTKPVTTNYTLINPGETQDILIEADQSPTKLYYIAISPYSLENNFDNTTSTAIIEYEDTRKTHKIRLLPSLPYYNDTDAANNFSRKLHYKGLPVDLPRGAVQRIIMTVSLNQINNSTRFSASLNNVSFVNPTIDILQAYYRKIYGVFSTRFPDAPPLYYNFTADNQPDSLLVPRNGTEVKVLKYMESVEMVLQGTSLVLAEGHPIHLHGYSFFVVGTGSGNFNNVTDPSNYNLDDPPLKNTVMVPRDGWVAVRFYADNPGVWLLHCHTERHLINGMNTVFIVKNGATQSTTLLPPPPDMPPC